MSTDNITILVKCFEGTNCHLSMELVSLVARRQIHTLGSKRNLASHVLTGVKLACENPDFLLFERKSKKHKGYVPLESEAEFREFLRSLKVKNVMKLIVRTKNGVPLTSKPAPAPHFSPGAEAVEHFRKLVCEFQNSEIYEFMRSFSGLYTQLMAPNGLFFDNDVADANDEKEKEMEKEKEAKEAEEAKKQERQWHLGTVHKGIVCDQCEAHEDSRYIQGLRYKCMVCPDFDLCSTCYERHAGLGAHSAQHAMLGIEDSKSFRQFLKFCGVPVVDFRYSGAGGSCPAANRSQAAAASAKQKQEDAEAARKKAAELVLLKEQAQNYQKLVSLVGRDPASATAFEQVSELITKAQKAAERTAKIDCVKAAEIDHEMDTEESEVGGKTPDEMNMEHSQEEEEEEEEVEVREMAIDAEPFLVEVAVVPKGQSLSQVLVTNRGASTIDQKGLALDIVNCFDMTVAWVPVDKRYRLVPHRTAKFNVPVSSSHFKYPFKVVLHSADLAGECLLSLKSMNGQLALIPKSEKSKKAAKPVAAAPEQPQMDEVTRQESCSSTPSFATASLHSIVLPSLRKEVQSQVSVALEQTVVAGTDVTMSESCNENVNVNENDGDNEENEDYDLISVTDAEGLDSDYEILHDGSSA